MVRVLPPLKPIVPQPPPGMALHVSPAPHDFFVEDFEFYDALGRDPFQQNTIWSLPDPEERAMEFKRVLGKYPKPKHRRRMLLTAATRGDEVIVRCFVEETDLSVLICGPQEAETGEMDHGQKRMNNFEEVKETTNNENLGNIETAENEDEKDSDDSTWTHPILQTAAYNGSLGCLKILIESGVPVDIQDSIGRTPLFAAASGYRSEVMRYLLEQGADPSVRPFTEKEFTKEMLGSLAGADVLEVAASGADIETVKLVLDHPVYKTKTKESGNSISRLAIRFAATNRFDVFKLLLGLAGFPVEDDDGKDKAELLNEEQKRFMGSLTPLVAERGDLETFNLVLSYLYPTDLNGNVLPFEVPEELHKPFTWGLYTAVAKNWTGKFEFLVSFRVKEHESMSLDGLPDGQIINIQHLLEKAVEAGSVECARLLIENYGADPDKARRPPCVQRLYYAAGNEKAGMVRYLLENHKVNIHRGSGRYAAGPTALWIAIHLKSLDSISVILEHGGPMEFIDEDILNLEGPVTAILKAETMERFPVRLETESRARNYMDKMRENFFVPNPNYVMIEVTPEDKDWIRRLQYRKPDDELREEGEGARELNAKEAVKIEELDAKDVRRVLVAIPTAFEEREKMVKANDDIMPEFVPAFEPVFR